MTTVTIEVSGGPAGWEWSSVDGGHVFQASPDKPEGMDGNEGDDTVTFIFFASPVTARHVKITVQSFFSGHAAMRAGLLLDPPSSGGLPADSYILFVPRADLYTASSIMNGHAIGSGHGRGQLLQTGGWVPACKATCAGEEAIGEWLEMDAEGEKTILGVSIQPRGDCCAEQRTVTFSVQTSTDGSVYADVDGGKVFEGSAASPSTAGSWVTETADSGDDTVTTIFFASPVTARHVRIIVQSKSAYTLHPSMRAGLILNAAP